jgi:hypothetical protein
MKVKNKLVVTYDSALVTLIKGDEEIELTLEETSVLLKSLLNNLRIDNLTIS